VSARDSPDKESGEHLKGDSTMVAAIAQAQGKDLFASFREPAWHRLGNVFTEEVTEYQRMLVLSGLADWNVRQVPMFTESGIEIPGQYAILADINGETRVLGVTGERYEIISNESAFAFLQSLADGARWETAGALKNGSVVFGSIAFERETVLDPTGVADVVKTYALVHTSHNGSKGLGGGLTPTRVVCQNTLNVALGNLDWRFKIRHTASAEERMVAQAELFRQAHVYFDAFEEEAQALYAKPVTDKQYDNLVTKIVGKAPENNVKGALTKYENKRELFTQAWKGAPNAGIRGTGWGAFNALTEANQWGRNTQDTDNGAENFAAAGAGFDIPTNAFRQKSLELVKAIR